MLHVRKTTGSARFKSMNLAIAVRTCVAVACLAVSLSAEAGDIYRWVDGDGRTQMSDQVPDKYRATAVRVSADRFELSPGQRAEAEDRAKVAKSRAAEPQLKRQKEEVALPPAPGVFASPAPKAQPIKPTAWANLDCATQRKLFKASEECFAPFHRTGGGLRPEALQACTELPPVSSKCS